MRVNEHNQMVLSMSDWLAAGLSYYMYENDKRRKNLQTTNRACYNSGVEILYESLREDRKVKIKEVLGNVSTLAKRQPLLNRMRIDDKAVTFFRSEFKLDDDRFLPEENITEYIHDASILNAIKNEMQDTNVYRRARGGTRINKGVFFQTVIEILSDEDFKKRYPNSLPLSERRLREKMDIYTHEGYLSLVSSKFSNINARKVSLRLERLLMALYTMPNKPFCANVKDLYDLFICNKIQVYDKTSGELYNPLDFCKNGEFITLSEATIWAYLNKPANRAVVDKQRNDGLFYNNTHRPHHHRHSPLFSFSKISMDDRDLPRKLVGGGYVKAYYAYDVTSGCVIGASYSRKKDQRLFIDCLRDMFRLIDRNNFGMPMEVEVEHHIVRDFADSIMAAGRIFPFVRWCAAGNSQEKRAEHFNKAKKYSSEKELQKQVTGRWWARSEAYRTPSKKVDNEYVENEFSYERLVADDLAAIRDYNNRPHPKKKIYEQMSRWEVLVENMNPNLGGIDKAMLYSYIGDCTECSIVRSQYVRVQYNKYQLSSPTILEKLKPGNYNVKAYYLSGDDGLINDVYLYQNDTYLCNCKMIETYNEAACERTEVDERAMIAQASYVAKYDKMIKDHKPDRVDFINALTDIAATTNKVETCVVEDAEQTDDFNFESSLAKYSPEWMEEFAIQSV